MSSFDHLRGDQLSKGYWGEHTSTIDWCEVNYAHTPYIAESINTLTNLPTILLGLYGWYTTRQQGLPSRLGWCHLGLSLIGIGSFGFHASLKWEWQLMDELPMIYVVSYAAYLVIDTLPGFKPRFGIFGLLVMLAWDVFVTVSYAYLPNPVYHQLAFGAIILSSTARTTYLILYGLPKDHPNRALIARTLAWGVATFVLGFVCWNIDNFFCMQLRAAREYMGIWGVFLEGHAYWHLMTGYGSYLIFISSCLLYMCIKTNPDAYTFDGKAFFPVVKPVRGTHKQMNGKAGGEGKRKVEDGKVNREMSSSPADKS